MERFIPAAARRLARGLPAHRDRRVARARCAPLLRAPPAARRAAGAPPRSRARARSRPSRPRAARRRPRRRRRASELAPRGARARCSRGAGAGAIAAPARRAHRCDRAARRCCPTDVDGDVLAGPLAGEDGPLGRARCSSARPPQRFDARARGARCAALLEPFARRARERPPPARADDAARGRRGRPPLAALAARAHRSCSETIVGAEAGLRPVMERVERWSRRPTCRC